MVAPFTYVAYPTRVVFGPGRLLELGAELDRLGVRRALLLSTPEQVALAEQVRQQLGNAAGGIFARATMHTPVDDTEGALMQLQARS
jgi:alcohol dehydrogenase class IV